MALSSKLMMMMAMYGMFMADTPTTSRSISDNISPRTKEEIDRIHKRQLLKKGCMEFHYSYGITDSDIKHIIIIALNKKNADRKYERFIKLWKESNL